MSRFIRTLIFGPLACLFGVVALTCFYGLMGREDTLEFIKRFAEGE